MAGQARVTLYEASDHFGGHTHTVDVTLGGRTYGVDTGFIVFNERAAPKLTALFAELGVITAPAEMSFSAQVPAAGLEWSSAGAGGVFAQPVNLLRPAFWNMLGEIVRFNRHAAALARSEAAAAFDDSVGDFLAAHRFSKGFRDWYLLPMLGCIWSCPSGQMLRMPARSMARFCRDHGLLQLTGRPRWHSVRGGASVYVDKMLEPIADARLATPVRQVRRLPIGGADVSTDRGSERFDAVVFAGHSVDSLAVLADPSADEREVLGAFHYQRNRAILHTDAGVLPQRRSAWAAWNYEAGRDAAAEAAVCVHVLVNRLQPLPFDVPVIVSLNPIQEPVAASVQGEFHYAHPVFDRRALAAQLRLPALQGRADTWFCGAWTGLGSHEDGLASGLDVCARLLARLAP
ncbi:MAG: FAD-dependent oxidoreductase [Pseudomonadota bacterium]|nr:FAD-dependent oxidoreductase [Pseudomonadota bacterium]